ncbi:acetate--CoA ligase family protein [Chloroflexota bacterium]
MRKNRDLDRLFDPSSLAIVGASKDDSRGGGRFLKRLINDGFKGLLYPINPRESELMGLKNYRSVLDIPGEIDLAILTIPAKASPQVIAECSQKGVKFAVVHSVGFSELGIEGKALEEEMVNCARQGITRIIGPNCMGIYSPSAHINTIALLPVSKDAAFETGSVGFAGQSGWVTENVIQMGHEQGLRFSKVVSIGNQCDLTIEDLLEYFGNDHKTKVIAFYVEGFKRGREFFQLAKQISKKKPIIVWKGGRSEVGVRAASSHTGALAGNDVVADAALLQSGAVIVENLEELLDLIVGFTCPILPQGNRIGLLVGTGGGGVTSADTAEALGLKIPMLPAETQGKLVGILQDKVPPFSTPVNPVDHVWSPAGDAVELLQGCSRIMLPEVDALVMITYSVFDEHFIKAFTKVIDETGKPIFIVPGHPAERQEGMTLLIQNGIPTFTIPERAIKVLAAMVGYSNYRQQS